MIVWNSEWINAFESPWSMFEKLCYANHITRTDLIRTLGSNEIQQFKNTLIGDKRRDLIRLSGFDHQKLHKYMGYDVVGQNNTDMNLILKPVEYIYESIHTWFPNSIRWCPDCMKYGYHSWVHQFILTERCPVHNTKILSSCPGCSYEIPFLLSDRRMDEPFTCSCGYKMANYSHWTEWKQSFEMKDSSMEHWLKGAGRRSSERFVFDPFTVGIDLFTTKPTITYNKINRKTNTCRTTTTYILTEPRRTWLFYFKDISSCRK
ncbi:TniQ family protein [Paenibacillus sp. NEAU-GSW1]|uniref:TniQ family protein n=1 Tax=Paenibacillus sp. NEAU-GSW1 TaxID=2682486 RepID=UPI0012E0F3F6|nr:hypothetical protein [Paenibacillus sp. NEAU-GSW1]